MDELNRKLLVEALERHNVCVGGVPDAAAPEDVIRQLEEIENTAWSESALEVENQPMMYRHLLSNLHELGQIEDRYCNCKQNYLKAITAQRYAELLGTVSDMDTLMELAVHTHPGLRPFVILRLEQRLPSALDEVSADAIPKWFVHLLRQPQRVTNFFSQAGCNIMMEKVQKLLTS